MEKKKEGGEVDKQPACALNRSAITEGLVDDLDCRNPTFGIPNREGGKEGEGTSKGEVEVRVSVYFPRNPVIRTSPFRRQRPKILIGRPNQPVRTTRHFTSSVYRERVTYTMVEEINRWARNYKHICNSRRLKIFGASRPTVAVTHPVTS